MNLISMKTAFYFVRHAESIAKAKGVVQGTGLAVPLSDLGREQARQLAKALKREKFDAIFSSQAVRAIETAKPIRAIFPHLPYSEHAELNERSKGEAEGMTKEEFKETYADVEAAWAKEEDPRIPGGESFVDVEKRVMPFLEKHKIQFAGKKLLYVGHGNVFRVILGAMLGIPANLRHRVTADYCALSVAEWDEDSGRWKVITVNKPLIDL